MTLAPTFADIRAAHARIAPYLHRTPIVTSSHLDAATGAHVFLKAENLQKVGAFKARGATNAVLLLTEDDARRGVATHSSGNHGQAVAFACAIRGVPATIVMPEHAPSVKIEAVRGYGADVVFCEQSEREATLQRLVDERGHTVVHPFDDARVIAGQGTASFEMLEDVPKLDVIITPIGGGGLLSGSTIVAAEYGVRTLGAEPEVVDEAFRSLRDGVRYPATGNASVGDGLLTGIGVIPFAILADANVSILTVSEDEILSAMRMLAERTKLVVEPSGSTGVAALLRYADDFVGKRVGVILSGGNVSLDRFASPAC